MNNFLDLSPQLRYGTFIFYNESISSIQNKFMYFGYFIDINDSNVDSFRDFLSSPYTHSELLSFLDESQSKNPLIFTSRHKATIKKAIFLRMFVHLYNSDISVKHFLSFVSRFNNFVYTHNLKSFDFSLLNVNNFVSSNHNGFREFAIAKYIRLNDIFSLSDLELFGRELIDYSISEELDPIIISYLEDALVSSLTEI